MKPTKDALLIEWCDYAEQLEAENAKKDELIKECEEALRELSGFQYIGIKRTAVVDAALAAIEKHKENQ